MTENNPAVEADVDPFDELLATGTVRRETVDIYFDQAAVDDLNSIAAEIDDLPDGPETINQTSRVREIEDRWNAAYERYEASRITFTLVPIDDEVVREIWEQFPNPPAPENPAKARWPIGQNAPDRERINKQRESAYEAFQEQMTVWRQKVDQQERERQLRYFAASIEKMSSVKGEREGVTLEQLEVILSGPYAKDRRAQLGAAFDRVSQVAGEIERPFSPDASGRSPA